MFKYVGYKYRLPYLNTKNSAVGLTAEFLVIILYYFQYTCTKRKGYGTMSYQIINKYSAKNELDKEKARLSASQSVYRELLRYAENKSKSA